MEWMILPFKRFLDFKGRSRRKEYWMYVLFVFITYIVLMFVDSALGLGGTATGGADLTGSSVSAGGALTGGVLTMIFALVTLIPSIAVSVRRLHDINRTGWWILLPLGFYLVAMVVALAGIAQAASGGSGGLATAGFGLVLSILAMITGIVLLVWYCMPGTVGPNRFGEDPKGQVTNADEVFG